ncbi:hypothetical protein ACFS5L_40070 [Streptomyces phyllanthi]|uniref:SRPBCC family protein n=1 Tax=Streptomyces phyllanthi TaxID=1803180 RepID=A0A5N8WDQ0_9ACTN|nr:hypothetical protein [Streptomyces phyllanthi]MPY45262.1 hypothetical protein [Streptomyces phyllanthi]
MDEVIEQGTGRTRGDTHTLHFTLHLPRHPVERVWPVVAGHGDGLRTWLAAADTFEPRLGGAVALRWLNTGPGGETPPAVAGRITAWDVERVAEYTLEGFHGRIRLHLEPDGEHGTTLRFSNEIRGDDELRRDCLAAWHLHFEYLAEALDGHPVDWTAWTPDRFEELRQTYAEA